MELGKHVLDKEMIDRNGERAWKVDDLLLDLPDASVIDPTADPEVVAIITGPTALSRNLSRPLRWLARQVYRLLGVADPKPVVIPWHDVAWIDVVVHLDIERRQAGLMELADAVDGRFIDRIPGS